MNVPKKVTDFIKLEEGNIGRKAAMVTGALLTSSVLGAVLTSSVQAAWCHCDVCEHWNETPCGDHIDRWYPGWNPPHVDWPPHCKHYDYSCGGHYDVSGECPLPC